MLVNKTEYQKEKLLTTAAKHVITKHESWNQGMRAQKFEYGSFPQSKGQRKRIILESSVIEANPKIKDNGKRKFHINYE